MKLRILTYNIEWFNRCFNTDNSMKTDTVSVKKMDAVSNVIKKIKPDILGIIEAPNSSKTTVESAVVKLENFANHYNLSINKGITGFISAGHQEIAVLYNPDKLQINHVPGGKSSSKKNPPFNKDFFYDTDDDKVKEVYKFYRPPLELEVETISSGKKVRIIVVHTKSKGIFSNLDRLHWERESRRNRIKLFAECKWIRNRIEEWLEDNHNVIVMGDINDGPGMDFYEAKYGKSAVEEIIGDVFNYETLLRNFTGRPKWTAKGWKPASARFKDSFTRKYVNVLIDHIFASAGVKVAQGNAFTIWNPYENDDAKLFMKDLKNSSDHFPVSLDIIL